MIRKITLFIISIFVISANANPSLADLLRSNSNDEKYRPKWALSRNKVAPSEAYIDNERVVINFNNRDLRFELPLRPDLFKHAGNKILPPMLDENDAEVLKFFEKIENPSEQKAIEEMSPLKRTQHLTGLAYKRIGLFSRKARLEKRLAKHERVLNDTTAKIREAYRQYDSLTLEQKARVNEMRRRVLKGLTTFLSSQFQSGVYHIGKENSIDSAVDTQAEKVVVPKLKEKIILKILENFNIQLFYLGNSILSTNEFGWVAIGAPTVMFPQFGWMYAVTLHVGYNMDDERIYIRVGTSRQRPSLVAGASVNLTLAPVGFYAAAMDLESRTQNFQNVSSYNPPILPTIGFAGKEVSMLGVSLPAVPIGPYIVPTSLIPYPLSEVSFYTTNGDMKMRAVGSFAVKKIKLKASKNPNAPQVAHEEVVSMSAEKKKGVMRNILSMAKFWKNKKCELTLTRVEPATVIGD